MTVRAERSKSSILIVDDQRNMRETLAMMARGQGHRVTTAATFEEGATAIKTGRFDFAAFDLRLEDDPEDPGGIGLLKLMRDAQPYAEVMVMTAYGTIESAVAAMRAGAFDYIQKPFSEDEFLVKLDMALKSRAQRSRAAETEALLLEQLEISESALSANERGSAFEIACRLAFSSIPGFLVRNNRRKEGEEIDLVIRNESADPFWSGFSPIFLAECKNPAVSPGRAELDAFVRKLERRIGICNLGFFLSSVRVSRHVSREAFASMREGPMVVVIDGEPLRNFLLGVDRSEILKSIVEEFAA
jgi:ActR/RegA family two-component response regulator